jgi:hypothetical protein
MNLHYGGRVGESMAVGEAAYIAGAGAGMMDVVTREAAARELGTVVQLHFDKTVEKKRAADAHKQELWRLFLAFFLFLALVLAAGPPPVPPPLGARRAPLPRPPRLLRRRRAPPPLPQQLPLPAALPQAHPRARRRQAADAQVRDVVATADVEVPYQEPPESYPAKFKRSWAIHFAFLIASHSLSHPLLLVDGAQPLPPPLLLSR